MFFTEKKPDGLDEKREAYDSILWEKIIVTKNGIEQVKVLTITVEEPDYKEACESLDTIEGTLTKDLGYITSGLIPLSGDERFFFYIITIILKVRRVLKLILPRVFYPAGTGEMILHR